MAILLPKGTKEFLVAVIVDKLGNLENLDDASAEFEVRSDSGELITPWESATTETGEMAVMCLIDTTNMDEGNYRLFVRIHVYPQVPILGPFNFTVESYSNDSS